MKKKKGISLIVLVITILVMIILAGVVIVNMSENNPIGKAKEATFKQNLAQIGEELDVFVAHKVVEMPGFSRQTLNANQTSCTYNDLQTTKEKNIYDILPSLKGTKYKDKIEIVQGVLFFRSPNKEEIAWLDDIGIFYRGIHTGGVTITGDTLVGVSQEYTGAYLVPKNITKINPGAFANCKRLTAVIFQSDITEIPDTCFYGCSSLQEIVLPETVTRIGIESFKQCNNLKNVNMPNNLEIIARGAFSQCHQLNNVVFKENLKTIEKYAFFECKALNNLTFAEGLTTIGQEVFERTGLVDVRLPESLTTLGYAAFIQSPNLASMYIGKNVTDMGGSIVRECPNVSKIGVSESNLKYYSQNNIVYEKQQNGKLVLLFAANNLANVVISNNTEIIKAEAFLGNKVVTSINIPKGVTTIEKRAFETCENLTTLNIPSSVTNIEKKVVQSCPVLTNLTVNNNLKYVAENGIIYEINNLKEKIKIISAANVITNYVMPNTITAIEEAAFASCSKLQNITIGTNELLITLPRETFHQAGFASITVPGNIKNIGKNCFSNCSNLTNLVLEEGVKNLSDSIMPHTAVESLHLPSTITQLYGPTFVFAEKLKTITVAAENPKYMAEGNAVYEKTNGKFNGVLVGYGAVSGTLKIKEGVTTIPTYALTQKQEVTKIEFPTTIKKIEVRALSDCPKLQSVLIPSSIEVIEKEAFMFTPQLKEIIIKKTKGSIAGSPWGATQGEKAIIWNE